MNVATVYLILVVIWIVLVIALRLYETNYIGLIILLIPIIIFAISTYYYNEHLVSNHTVGSDDDFLSLGLILLLPLLAYLDKSFDHHDKSQFICIIIVSLFIFLVTTMVCWVPQRYAKMAKMLRTGLQVIAISLVLVSIHIYYQHRCHKIREGCKDLLPIFDM